MGTVKDRPVRFGPVYISIDRPNGKCVYILLQIFGICRGFLLRTPPVINFLFRPSP